VKKISFSTFGLSPIDRRVALVEEDDHEVLPLDEEHGQRHDPDDDELQGVLGRDGQDIAEDDGLDAHRCRRQRHHEEAEAEERGEDETDDGVFLEARALIEEQHRAGGERPGEEGSDRERQAEHVGAGDAGDDGVGERIADQRPALQHQIGGKEGADGADQRRDPHGVQHVFVAERLEEGGDHSAASRVFCCIAPFSP
jgi:hypothetical protein